jgi:predicted metal-dependent phosphoesterase TrpH
MIDLHCHSTASDGSLSPTALIDLAAERGLCALALTDHDSVSGLAEAQARADLKGIRFVRGVEIEVEFKPGEFHLLGLDFEAGSPGLDTALAILAEHRQKRNRQIIDQMRQDGMAVDWEELRALSGSSMIGRPHIAQYLVRKGLVKRRQVAFDKYIGKGRPYYVPKACISLEEGVKLIHDSGGLAFVAHPMSLFVSWTRLREMFPQWKEMGIDGVEAWHPAARRGECDKLEALAVQHGLRITAGSDFHGEARPERKLGITAGDKKIEDRFLAALERGND